MRTRFEIENDGARVDILALETLLDIRELLMPPKPKVVRSKPRRTKKKVKKNG